MTISAIDERDLDRHRLEGPGRGKAAKAGADDDHAGQRRGRHVGPSGSAHLFDALFDATVSRDVGFVAY
jgi:hypothetical protein